MSSLSGKILQGTKVTNDIERRLRDGSCESSEPMPVFFSMGGFQPPADLKKRFTAFRFQANDDI